MSTIRCDNFGPSAGGTTYSARGIAKAWGQFNEDTSGGDPVFIRDSMNISSLTDDGTGRLTASIANNMANTNFAVSTGGGGAVRNNTLTNVATPSSLFAVGSIGIDSQYQHVTAFDPPRVTVVVFGDLA